MLRPNRYRILYTQLTLADFDASFVFYRQFLELTEHSRETGNDKQLTHDCRRHFEHLAVVVDDYAVAHTCNQSPQLCYVVISAPQVRSLTQSDIAYLEVPDGYPITLVQVQLHWVLNYTRLTAPHSVAIAAGYLASRQQGLGTRPHVHAPRHVPQSYPSGAARQCSRLPSPSALL